MDWHKRMRKHKLIRVQTRHSNNSALKANITRRTPQLWWHNQNHDLSKRNSRVNCLAIASQILGKHRADRYQVV